MREQMQSSECLSTHFIFDLKSCLYINIGLLNLFKLIWSCPSF